jgi:hypothetical protein
MMLPPLAALRAIRYDGQKRDSSQFPQAGDLPQTCARARREASQHVGTALRAGGGDGEKLRCGQGAGDAQVSAEGASPNSACTKTDSIENRADCVALQQMSRYVPYHDQSRARIRNWSLTLVCRGPGLARRILAYRSVLVGSRGHAGRPLHTLEERLRIRSNLIGRHLMDDP